MKSAGSLRFEKAQELVKEYGVSWSDAFKLADGKAAAGADDYDDYKARAEEDRHEYGREFALSDRYY